MVNEPPEGICSSHRFWLLLRVSTYPLGGRCVDAIFRLLILVTNCVDPPTLKITSPNNVEDPKLLNDNQLPFTLPSIPEPV